MFSTNTPSRAIGYPGYERNLDVFTSLLNELGLSDVHVCEFDLAVPVEEWASITIGGRTFRLHSIAPNLVASGPHAVEGEMVDAGSGRLEDLRGVALNGRIVVLDLTSGDTWQQLATFGAAAFIFVQPPAGVATYRDYRSKVLAAPVEIPRYLVERSQADDFRAVVARGGRGAITRRLRWTNATARTISVLVPGTRSAPVPGKAGGGEREAILSVHAGLDAVSLVPSLAPGGDGLFNLMVLEELLRGFVRRPPALPVLVTAFSGNAYALSGARHFAYRLLTASGRPSFSREQQLVAEMQELEAVRALLTADALADPISFLRRLSQGRQGLQHPLIAKLYGLIAVETATLSHQLLMAAARGGSGGTPEAQAVEALLQQRERLNYLASLRYRRFQDQEAVGRQRHPIVRLFRARNADAPADPALVAGAPSELTRCLLALKERLGAQIECDQTVLHRLRMDRRFTERLDRCRIVFHLGLDLAASAQGMTLAAEGDCLDLLRHSTLDGQLGEFLVPFTDRFNREHGTRSEGETPNARGRDFTVAGVPALLNVLPGEHGKRWRDHVHYPVVTGGEALELLGIPGLTLCGSNDARLLYDTPEDDLARIDEATLAARLSLASDCARGLLDEICRLLTDDSIDRRMKLLPLDADPDNRDWCRIDVAVGRPGSENAEKSIRGIKGVLVVRDGILRQGLRGWDLQMSDPAGRVAFPLVPTRWVWSGRDKTVKLNAFGLDERSGLVVQAMDRGEAGKIYPTEFIPSGAEKGTSLIMFECRSIGILGAYDPRTFKELPAPRIFSGRTDDQLRLFGWHAAEGSTVCFVPPADTVRVLYPGDDFFVRMMMLNSRAECALGRGFEAREQVLLTPPLQSARDMWWRTRDLQQLLDQAGIRSGLVDYLQEKTLACVKEAETALAARDYGACLDRAHLAWSLASRAYPKVLKLANSTVHGLVFYLFLLIPCALILERLICGFTRVATRGAAVAGFGFVLYEVISYLHPAVRIIRNPLVLFIAYGLLALSGYVIALVWSRFEAYMARWKMKARGVTGESLSRAGAFGLAVSVGIGNMRRAGARTLLTVVSLTLFTIVVVSLVSVQVTLGVNAVRPGYRADFEGLMIRDRTHAPLSSALAPALRLFYSKDCDLYEMRISDRTMQWTSTWATMAAISGVPPEVQRRLLKAGEPLLNEEDACLLPDLEDPKTGLRTAALIGTTRRVAGREVKVAGIFDPALFNRLVGLDGQPMTPIDLDELAEQREINKKLGQEEIDVVPLRVPAEQTVILSQGVMNLLDGHRDSVVLLSKAPGNLKAVARDLVLRTDLYAYYREGDEGLVYSVSDRGRVKGLADIGIPVLICGLIILNTMLGAVASQMRHIPTFSAVGLAPKHIARLFFVEALVYSVLAVVGGYVVGQFTAKGITAWNLIPGLTLDYSSAASLLGSAVVIGVASLSTAYPAWRAMTEATPKSDEDDRPVFEGDRMSAVLPFTLTGRPASGGIGFLYAFIAEHDEMLGADSFFVQNAAMRRIPGGGGRQDFEITFDLWLAPIDLGNSERVRIWTETDKYEVMNIRVEARRKTGELHSWRTCNLGFLSALRKQMLLWRTVEETDRDRYVRLAEGAREALPLDAGPCAPGERNGSVSH